MFAQTLTGVDPVPISSQTVFTIIISLAVLGGIAWLLRRGASMRRSRLPVSVETAVPLGERRSLVIVAVGKDKIDFGDGYGQIDVIQGAYPGGGVAWQWIPQGEVTHT